MVKNCAIGLTDVVYLVWRTLVQYSDTAYVQRLAQACCPDSQGVFHDAVALENYEFIDRRDINLDLAIGFLSDENLINKTQTDYSRTTGICTDTNGSGYILDRGTVR